MESTDRAFLSVTSDGSKVDLWPEDDASGRQRWIITDIPGRQDACNVFIVGGISNSKKYLSVPGDGRFVDLWYNDDASGRQRWIFDEIVGGPSYGCCARVCAALTLETEELGFPVCYGACLLLTEEGSAFCPALCNALPIPTLRIVCVVTCNNALADC